MSYEETKTVYFENPKYDPEAEDTSEEYEIEVTIRFEVTDYPAVYSGPWTAPADTEFDPIEFSVGDIDGLDYKEFCQEVGSERADQLINEAIESF